jgi:hypothetical protein
MPVLRGLQMVASRYSRLLALDGVKAASALQRHGGDVCESFKPSVSGAAPGAAPGAAFAPSPRPSSPPSRPSSPPPPLTSSQLAAQRSHQASLPLPSFTTSPLPSSRLSRVSTFSGLAFSLLSAGSSSARADALTGYLCRLRGGALKLGQMLSIQEDSLLPKEWVRALERVRKAADVMPREEVRRLLETTYGPGYEELLPEPGVASSLPEPAPDPGLSPASLLPKLPLRKLEAEPLAAASIGQVHKVEFEDGTWGVAKLQ